jgi:hypothetical protein
VNTGFSSTCSGRKSKWPEIKIFVFQIARALDLAADEFTGQTFEVVQDVRLEIADNSGKFAVGFLDL